MKIWKVSQEEWVARGHARPAWPYEPVPGEGERVYCLHCGGSFVKGREMVDSSDGLLVCPTLECDGSPMDWSETPWE